MVGAVLMNLLEYESNILLQHVVIDEFQVIIKIKQIYDRSIFVMWLLWLFILPISVDWLRLVQRRHIVIVVEIVLLFFVLDVGRGVVPSGRRTLKSLVLVHHLRCRRGASSVEAPIGHPAVDYRHVCRRESSVTSQQFTYRICLEKTRITIHRNAGSLGRCLSMLLSARETNRPLEGGCYGTWSFCRRRLIAYSRGHEVRTFYWYKNWPVLSQMKMKQPSDLFVKETPGYWNKDIS